MKVGKLTKLEKAYIAGIIDGEGCIYLGKAKNRTKSKKKYSEYLYNSSLSVEMSCQSVPQWLHDKCGGGLYSRKRKHRVPVMWTWKASGKRAEKLLAKIYDYLVEKRGEVDIFMQYRDIIKNSNRHIKITNEEVLERDELIKKLRNERKTYHEK